jgi:predicted patatin/cPLA2 family phospholipase
MAKDLADMLGLFSCHSQPSKLSLLRRPTINPGLNRLQQTAQEELQDQVEAFSSVQEQQHRLNLEAILFQQNTQKQLDALNDELNLRVATEDFHSKLKRANKKIK